MRYFNPRTLTGATRRFSFSAILIIISIHAPLRVRRKKLRIFAVTLQFQSTHPHGCDRKEDRPKWLLVISIHAPLRVRRGGGAKTGLYAVFQSTHPYGCDFCQRFIFSSARNFNPRTLTGATFPPF